MKHELTLAVCGVALLAALECPVLLVQTERANPVRKASDLSVPTCDSLKNPASGESLTPCRRCDSHRFWFDGEVWQCWNCVPPPSADMVRVDINERVN